MKTRIITWIITLGAFLDTLIGVISDNPGLLAELGVSPKITKVIMLLGLIWTAFSKSLNEPKQETKKIIGGRSDER